MDAKYVYYQLQELFPQVDPRILKAVAIEHSNDCDSAAEFIINEVLPTFDQPSKLNNSTPETDDVSCFDGQLDEHREQNTSDKQVFEALQPESTHRENDDLCDSAHIISNSVSTPVQVVELEPDNCSSVYILEHISTPVPHPANSASHSPNVKGKNIQPIEIIDVEASKYVFQNDLECAVDTIVKHDSSTSSPFSETEGKNMTTEENVIVSGVPSSCDVRGLGTAISEDSTNSSSLFLNAKGKNVIDVEACYYHFSSNTGENTVASTTDSEDINTMSSGHEEQLSTCCNVIEKFKELATKYDDGAFDGCEEHLLKPLANGSEQSTNNDVALVEKTLPKLLTSRSGHVINIDLLEDCVADAKSNKTDLVFAVQSVIDMIKEVEFLEEKCIQTKEEASSAGEDILAKVNELKEMLQHAKQANDMHAGEVFGEKSVLITEARELQSRLLNLAEEKDKSLSLVEQMRESLETRMLAARNAISAAEKQKLEKEGLALKALEEQEAVMESVVQEAKKLNEASEENAKLREFLDDRGRLVDALEGEIAVICEDVMALKRRVDEQGSLKGSLLIVPYGSNSSRSSSLSGKSTELSKSGVLPEEQQVQNKTDSTFAFSQELENLTNTNCLNEKFLSDEDDWEILRNEVGQF